MPLRILTEHHLPFRIFIHFISMDYGDMLIVYLSVIYVTELLNANIATTWQRAYAVCLFVV